MTTIPTAPSAGRGRRLARNPLVRIAALGALLFAGRAAVERARPPVVARPERSPIVLSAQRVRSLESAFVKQYGRAPRTPERASLIAQAVQDEMLYREARLLSLGFQDASVHRRLVEMMRAVGEGGGSAPQALVQRAMELGLDDDIVIRRLLSEKMRLVLQQGDGGMAIRDEDLKSVLERERERFLAPPTVNLTQIFFSADTRGKAEATDAARRMLADLRAGRLSGEDASAISDPLPFGNDLRGYAQPQVQGRFGKPFAQAVFALEVGRWSDPIESPFGLHLVLVTDKRPESLPPLDEVRSALVETLRRERARENLARGLERLRGLYEVRIEDPGPAADTPLDVASAR